MSPLGLITGAILGAIIMASVMKNTCPFDCKFCHSRDQHREHNYWKGGK